MTSSSTKMNTRKGFTLVEMLIVITILGTLAVALLAAIDPFEQFKKANDTARRNTVQELFNAYIRYYAQRSAWPTAFDGELSNGDVEQVIGATNKTAALIDPFVAAGELKENFTDLAQDQLKSIWVGRYNDKVLVCFLPGSKSVQSADKNTRFSAASFDNGTPATTSNSCKLNGGTNDCYWCVY